jgi:hypothetical protein
MIVSARDFTASFSFVLSPFWRAATSASVHRGAWISTRVALRGLDIAASRLLSSPRLSELQMTDGSVTRSDRWLARVCVNCPVCRQARRRQTGVFFRLVQKVERGLCPFCRAYERVYGRPAHEAGGAVPGRK